MKLILILISLLISTDWHAETRYVSDSLTIFLRTGPTHQFRIVGTLAAGEVVEIIADDVENNATHIQLTNGRQVWVDTVQLITNKPSSLLLEEVTLKFHQLTNTSNKKISDLQQDLERAVDLAAQSQMFRQQLTQLEYDKELLEQKNQTLSERSRYDLLTAGGFVAFVGILLGLIIPRFIRRKRHDVWR